MSIDNGKRFIELLEKREKLIGTRIFNTLIHLATSHYGVNRNYQELSLAISRYEKSLSIWAVKDRPQLDAFLRELSRLLQNYLSSIYSLVQHTMIICNDLNCPKLNADYASQLKVLQRNNCVRFVRDLRTYSQHIRLPAIAARLSFRTIRETGTGEIKQQILLEKKELTKWTHWHNDSKEYINSHNDIDLKVVLSEYQSLIKDFYQWFYKKVEELYPKELQEFYELESELARLS